MESIDVQKEVVALANENSMVIRVHYYLRNKWWKKFKQHLLSEGDVESITTTETYSERVDASSTSVPAPLSASAKKIQAVDVPKKTDLAPECNIIINTGILLNFLEKLVP